MSNGETVKAQRATVRLGELEVEGFMLPNGSDRMSPTQAASCVDKDESNARKFFSSKAVKRLLGEGYTPGKNELIEIEATEQPRGQTRFRPLTLDEVIAFWTWETHRGNKKALALTFALQKETIERRFDAAFGVERTEEERNQRLSQQVQQLQSDLEKLGEGYAMDDDVKAEQDYFLRLLQQQGVDPYEMGHDDERGEIGVNLFKNVPKATRCDILGIILVPFSAEKGETRR